MKFLVFVSLACLAAFANASGLVNVYGAYDDGQWHGEGLWESQDHESLAARAYAYGAVPAAYGAVPAAYGAHVPWAAARALPVPHAVPAVHPVPAAYSVPVAAPAVPVAHGYSASISGPSGHIGALS